MRVCLVKKILQFLTRKFKKISENIQRQIDKRYDDLRDSHLVKEKIEQWMQKWETLREKMISLKIDSIYSEHIYTQHFLKIERTWASFFCDTWVKLQKTSRRLLDFFEIVNEYRIELKKLVVTSRRQHSTNSTSLQKQKSFAFASINDNKYENFECLCDETHAWKNCSFLIVESRSLEWKANKKKRDQIRQKLESHFKLFWYV
jgi:hypothetical protein